MAGKIDDLELPEQATQFDLTGLGLLKPRQEMGAMDEIDQEIADLIAKHTESLGAPRKPKSGFRSALVATRESDKKRIARELGG